MGKIECELLSKQRLNKRLNEAIYKCREQNVQNVRNTITGEWDPREKPCEGGGEYRIMQLSGNEGSGLQMTALFTAVSVRNN